ncbi:MAG: hypothetical protein ABJH63_05900 [Rhizobiaceae bacterium]
MPRIIILLWLALLAGCVTSTPDQLLNAEPQGVAKKDGFYPVFGRIPVGQTTQMTPTEKAEMRAELTREGEIARRRAGVVGPSSYQSEVSRMKKLAQDRLNALTTRIEGANSGEESGSGESGAESGDGSEVQATTTQ